MKRKLIHISELVGKEFKGDPRTRKSTGELRHVFSDTIDHVVSNSVKVIYEEPKRKPKNRQDEMSWFRWSWEQTSPPVHQSCCYSGLADTPGHCDDTFFLVDEVKS